jgi:hypothetical protein
MSSPPLTESNVRHLLRRTEFVDRPQRVDELMRLGSIAAAVADILAVASHPPSVQFTAPADRDWERGRELTHFWLDRMAHDSARPVPGADGVLLARALLQRVHQGQLVPLDA